MLIVVVYLRRKCGCSRCESRMLRCESRMLRWFDMIILLVLSYAVALLMVL